jgi:RimJ/RimL family protein N-acetyltransferase
MADLRFERLVEADLPELRSWFSDAELRRRYGFPTPAWFEYVSNQAAVHAWVIWDGELAVGVLQLDALADQTGHMGFYVKPALRGRGYGKRILSDYLSRMAHGNLNRIIAEAECDNLASHRCLLTTGFVQDRADEDGFIRFVYKARESVGQQQQAAAPTGDREDGADEG